MGKNNIKISVIMPVYNASKYLKQSIECVLNQTLKEIELICVDDGSTDNSVQIIEEYAKNDKRITLVKFEKNLGTSQARKEGVLKSNGQYIMFLDPDDTYSEKAIETAYNSIIKKNVDILQFGVNVINCGASKKSYDEFVNKCEPYGSKLENKNVFLGCFEQNLYNFNIWNKIYNGDVTRKAFTFVKDGYFPKAQDVYAFAIIAYLSKSYDSISADTPLYNYYYGRGITGNATISVERFSKVATQIHIIEEIVKFLDSQNIENFEPFVNSVFRHGKNFYNEIKSNYLKVENLEEHNYEVLNLLLENLNLTYTEKDYKNKQIYNKYISYIFQILDDLYFKQDIGYNKLISDFAINFCTENNLFEKDYKYFIFNSAKKSKCLTSNNKKIPIVFATNDNYAPYLGVAIQSIIENASNENVYDINVFQTSLSASNQYKLQNMSTNNVSIKIVNVLPYLKDVPVYSHSHYSNEMYYRILIPEIMENYDKVIYLDCDLVVTTDIANLYDFDMQNNYVCAVINDIVSDYMKKYVLKTLNLKLEQYFNSGVLIIDTKKFNDNKIKQKCFDLLSVLGRLQCPDQDILNLSCLDHVLYLDNSWNFQTQCSKFTLEEKYFQNHNIIHYTTGFKPWNTADVALSDYFWKYAKLSPFFDKIISTFLSSTLQISSSNIGQTEGVTKTAIAVNGRNIINKDFKQKHWYSWPFRKIKEFFNDISDFGWKQACLNIKENTKYAFNRLKGKVDINNNVIINKKMKRTKPFVEKNYDYYKNLPVKNYEKELQDWYNEKTNSKMDINNPQNYSEKLQWLKLNDSTLLKSHLTDKWLAKEYVKSVAGSKYIINTLGVYDKFEDIDFDVLPDQFVIKSTHASGQVIVVKNKNTLDKRMVKLKTDKWLAENFAYHAGFEIHYNNIIPRIIIEELMTGINDDLYDYKIFCFNGEPKFIWVDCNRFINHKRNFYDLNWKLMPIKKYHYEMDDSIKIPKPKRFDEMIKLSKKLSKPFALCRCDFYVLEDDSIKFGELTFTSASGIPRFDPVSYDYEFGKLLKLPEPVQFKKLSKRQILKSEKEFLASLKQRKGENK